MDPNNSVAISLISTLGGITIAYITNVLAKRVQAKREAKEPKDRMEQLLDGYDRALKQKDADNDELRAMLREAQDQLREVERKLNHSYYENSRLKGELERMRAQYHNAAKLDQKDRDNVRKGLDESDKRNGVR